jgi:hypothetical protein
MPRGPKGERRPADAIGAAIAVAKIATGEAEDAPPLLTSAGKAGAEGGKVRARNLSPEQRKSIAQKAAKSRWGKGQAAPGKKEHA